MLERESVRHPRSGPSRHRSLEDRLQHRSTTSSPWKPSSRGVRSWATNQTTAPAIRGITRGCTSRATQVLCSSSSLSDQFSFLFFFFFINGDDWLVRYLTNG